MRFDRCLTHKEARLQNMRHAGAGIRLAGCQAGVIHRPDN